MSLRPRFDPPEPGQRTVLKGDVFVNKLRFRIGAASVVLAATLVPAGFAGAAGVSGPGPVDDRVAVKSERLCARPATRPATPGASLDTYDPKDEWLANDAAQAAVRRLNSMVEGRADILGVVPDDTARKLIVVRDPAQPHSAKLTAELKIAVGNDLKIVVQPGCRARGGSDQVAEKLRGKTWLPEGSKINFSFRWDAAGGRYTVVIPPGALEEEAALRAEFGDRIGIAQEFLKSPAVGDRLNDASAHYGGARIRVNGNGDCTAGFTAVANTGKHYMITAGHCADLNGLTNGIEGNDRLVYSGSRYYGITSDQRAPDPDAILIGSGGETYDRKIHVDPCCPSVRTVIDQRDVGVNEYVCVSGSITRSVCGARVELTMVESCTGYGCMRDTYARRAGVQVATQGDSGGPVYQRTGSSDAIAAGIVSGANPAGNGDYVFFNTIGRVIGGFPQLGLRLKTTGGPA